MVKPLVTITIPTYNSAKTINLCLSAIIKQSYKNIEVNIIDGESTDDTLLLVKKFHITKIKRFPGSLLGARFEGVKIARGKYTLILDSDQILEKTCIERAVNMAEKENLDMLVFREDVYKSNTFLEKLFKMDRKLIEAVSDLSPFTGVIMPRFFNTQLLKKAYLNIPSEVYPNTGGPDHAIVYYEAWCLSKKIDVLTDAVKHIEPDNIGKLWSKFYRWGYTSVDVHTFKKYHKLMMQKERFRTGLFRKDLLLESLGSILLLILKGVPFRLGYYRAYMEKFLIK